MAVINNLVLALLLHGGHTCPGRRCRGNNAPKVRRHYAAHPDEALKLLLNRLA